MAATLALYRSSIGKKTIMALTGLIGIGFVILHMIGNLKVFLGAQAFNDYASFLRTFGEPVLPYSTVLWIIRLVLLGAVVLHISAAYQLTRIDLAGRRRPAGRRGVRGIEYMTRRRRSRHAEQRQLQ